MLKDELLNRFLKKKFKKKKLHDDIRTMTNNLLFSLEIILYKI